MPFFGSIYCSYGALIGKQPAGADYICIPKEVAK